MSRKTRAEMDAIDHFDPVAAYKIALARKLCLLLGMHETARYTSPGGYTFIKVTFKDQVRAVNE